MVAPNFRLAQIFRRVALCSFAVSALSATGQMLPPDLRGDCPGSPPVGNLWPEITAPAHRHDIDLQGTERAAKLRLVAWRVPCSGSPGQSRLFLRLSTASFGGKFVRFPRFSVIQNGAELGSFSSQSGPPGDRRLVFQATSVSTSSAEVATAVAPLISGDPSVPFDPLQRVTLLIRPAGWMAGQPDLRVDIPAANEPGNHGFVPRQIAGQWWNPARPGWGLTLARNERETVYAAWMTYDDAGDSTWFVMPYSESTPDGEIRGAVYAPQGRPFGPPESTPANLIALQPGEPVGTFGLRFNDEDNGEFSIDIQGVRRTEPIRRQRIRTPAGSACNASSGAHWDPRINGWGLGMEGSLQDRNCATQLTLLTYDSARRPVWYFVPMIPTGRLVTFTIPATFITTLTLPVVDGEVYRPRGTPWRIGTQSEVILGAPLGKAETPKLDNGSGLLIRIGGQEVILLPEPFLFEF